MCVIEKYEGYKIIKSYHEVIIMSGKKDVNFYITPTL